MQRPRQLAEKIADRLMFLSGINQPATLLTPSIPAKDGEPEKVGGSYCRSEVVDAIYFVIMQETPTWKS